MDSKEVTTTPERCMSSMRLSRLADADVVFRDHVIHSPYLNAEKLLIDDS